MSAKFFISLIQKKNHRYSFLYACYTHILSLILLILPQPEASQYFNTAESMPSGCCMSENRVELVRASWEHNIDVVVAWRFYNIKVEEREEYMHRYQKKICTILYCLCLAFTCFHSQICIYENDENSRWRSAATSTSRHYVRLL